MGKCVSKEEAEPREEMIELEKTLQLYLNDREEYKNKYETVNNKYQQTKAQLINALNAVKYLKRHLRASEERASALYLRYAIESDLNRRLNQLTQQKLKEEKERLKRDQGQATLVNVTNAIMMEQLRQFEQRLCQLETRSSEVKYYQL